MEVGGPLIVQTLIQTVPIWTFVGIAVKYWIDKSNKASEEFQKDIDNRFEKMEQAILLIQESVKRIELSMAMAHLPQVREDLESLKEAKVRVEMKADSALRHIDEIRIRPK